MSDISGVLRALGASGSYRSGRDDERRFAQNGSHGKRRGDDLTLVLPHREIERLMIRFAFDLRGIVLCHI